MGNEAIGAGERQEFLARHGDPDAMEDEVARLRTRVRELEGALRDAPKIMIRLCDRLLRQADSRVLRDGLSLKYPDAPCDEYRAQLRLAFPEFFGSDDEWTDDFDERMPKESMPLYREQIPALLSPPEEPYRVKVVGRRGGRNTALAEAIVQAAERRKIEVSFVEPPEEPPAREEEE